MIKNDINLNKINFFSIQELISSEQPLEFYVAPYQRGYKWGVSEIEYLLDDINEIKENEKYCLQPLTVRWNSKNWELIDGQQRLTTIWLILTILKNDFNSPTSSIFSLNYDTRPSTRDFLNNDIASTHFDGANSSLEDIEQLWDTFISRENNNLKNNIDNFHIFQAYYIIKRWFSTKKYPIEISTFREKLEKQTFIIWNPVEIQGKQDMEDYFINMNAGKIKLTSSELIKALFILKIDDSNDSWDIKEFKKKELANEWNQIENELQNKDFWFFINNSNRTEYPTRIGKLFDLMTENSDEKNDLYAYHLISKYPEKYSWENVVLIFNKLKEWYEDIPTFHRIGFLINSGTSTLQNIHQETVGQKQSTISTFLSDSIISDFKKFTSLDDLNYETNPEMCQKTLLLYNILLIEEQFPGQRFPFDHYQEKEWSLEHIHPQNPRGFKTIKEIKIWMEDYKKRMEEIRGVAEEEEKELLEKLKTLEIKINENPKDENSNISKKTLDDINEFVEQYKDIFELHGIGNLALLDKKTNSKIGNKSFLEKRSVILNPSPPPTTKNDIKDKPYIPLGTLHNFTKSTTNEIDNLQMQFWSLKDANDYKNKISKVLDSFLTENPIEQ
ncbi:DUF262 domain-containing protein [Marinilabilia salmonicolor]|uniref:Uncharacterized protein DUF1524 n=1 Tax=Marinilabilia salmonicolor TaxID=989 RepID=A0A368UYG6_9BACT|nr:DUF262 domain-containing protein [Marinilabilia salmonicolor]RCW33866.1 uncharacterized protein DUF1524 [Marinilabilia salmonicolor]